MPANKLDSVDDLIKLVKTYRLTAPLDQRLQLAEEIFRHVEPKLRFFIFGSVAKGDAPDVLQEVLRAVATSLRTFGGGTNGEFWAWCYRIARNKTADHFRRQGSDRLFTMPDDELRQLIDASAKSTALAPGERTDLEFAMKLLAAAKPECHTLLWAHYVQGFDYAEIADEHAITYDAARMKISRCLNEARLLVA